MERVNKAKEELERGMKIRTLPLRIKNVTSPEMMRYWGAVSIPGILSPSTLAALKTKNPGVYNFIMNLRKSKNSAPAPQGSSVAPSGQISPFGTKPGGTKWLWLMIGVFGFFAITALSSKRSL